MISRDIVDGLLPLAKRRAERPKPKLIKTVYSSGVEVVAVGSPVEALGGK